MPGGASPGSTATDPSVNFGLQFEFPVAKPRTAALPAKVSAEEMPKPPQPAAELATLDKFRKR